MDVALVAIPNHACFLSYFSVLELCRNKFTIDWCIDFLLCCYLGHLSMYLSRERAEREYGILYPYFTLGPVMGCLRANNL